VSKALNDGRGSPEVRRRVERAATRLGYRPNQRARGLRRAESRSIGVLVPDLANSSFLPMLRGAEHAARERGYVVLIADGQRSDAAEQAALERFFDQGVDGLLLAGAVPAGSLRLYLDHGVPIAPAPDAAGRVGRGWEAGETHATRQMAERLLVLGHRRYVFVSTPAPKGHPGRRYRRSRVGALAETLEGAGATMTVTVVDPSPGLDVTVEQLRAAVTDGSPTAVICGSHLLAPNALLALDAAGLRLPRDVSFVAYGDSDWARAYRPPLSVVRRDTYAEGFELATALLDAIADEPHAEVPPPAAEWVERASIAGALSAPLRRR
jgi:LacI family transcriptional regulator